MRFTLAVAIAAAAQLLVYLRFAGAASGAPLLVLSYIVLATLGAGWFAARRGALAGALSVAVAAALYAAATLLLGPAGIGMSLLDLAGNVLGLVATFWPYIAIGGIAGALGGTLRGRMLTRR